MVTKGSGDLGKWWLWLSEIAAVTLGSGDLGKW